MTGNIAQMAFGLAIVLSAIALVAWLARRMGLGASKGTRLMQVVTSVSVGVKERVIVVEVGAQWMILGVAPGRVNLLATLPAAQTPPVPDAPATIRGIDFAALIGKARQRA